jgi:hypothetical protein
LKGEGKEAIPGENCGGLAESDVTSRTSTAQVVVINRGKIVVHQRKGMQHFKGASGIDNGLRICADGVGGSEAKDGPKSLSGGQACVPHRLA